MFGHEEEHCKKKVGTKRVWRPIQKMPSLQEKDTNTQHFGCSQDIISHENDTQTQQNEQNARPDYNPVLKRTAAHKTQATGTTQPDHTNSFQALQELNGIELVDKRSTNGVGESTSWSISQVRT